MIRIIIIIKSILRHKVLRYRGADIRLTLSLFHDKKTTTKQCRILIP